MEEHMQEQTVIPHGKHKGRMLWEVIQSDPNYALYASAGYNWFPKLTRMQIEDCSRRYKRLPRADWSTYDMADYGEDWV